MTFITFLGNNLPQNHYSPIIYPSLPIMSSDVLKGDAKWRVVAWAYPTGLPICWQPSHWASSFLLGSWFNQSPAPPPTHPRPKGSAWAANGKWTLNSQTPDQARDLLKSYNMKSKIHKGGEKELLNLKKQTAINNQHDKQELPTG